MAFVSPRPPPALLPILSPILRQRVQIFSSGASNSPRYSWLRFLCWDAAQAEHLQELVDGTSFEPHPVSGEVDLPGDIPVAYKQVDEETLHSQVSLPEYGLRIIYLWCPDDDENAGWKVAEVLPRRDSDGDDGGDPWHASIGEAKACARENLLEYALKQAEGQERSEEVDDDDDEDAYWAQYDEMPGRTPSAKPDDHAAPVSEKTYFDRYNDVQPALDNHDPSEAVFDDGESSVNGDQILTSLLRRQMPRCEPAGPARRNGYPPDTTTTTSEDMLNHPRPSSASSLSSSSSNTVAKLEQEAETHSACEVGVRLHIGSNVQSLFRLAKTAGISREDFQSLVKTELDSLER